MLHKTIKDLISKHQNSPIEAPDNSIPLFVDVGAEVVFTAAFKNNTLKDYSVYSSLPIMACSVYYPNIIFSLIPTNILSKMKIIEIKNIHDYSEFSFNKINELKNDKKCHLFGLPDNFDDKDRIINICTNILNPLGIGAFYSKDFDLFTAIDDDPKEMSCEFLPYSMEIARKMLFQSISEQFSVFSVASLMVLQYPLPKITIPKPDLHNLKDRFIFSKFIINNPPLLNDETKSKLMTFKITPKDFLSDDTNDNTGHQPIGDIKLTEMKPYQWAHIVVYHFCEHFQPNEKIEAFIGKGINHDFKVLQYNEKCLNVRKELQNNEAYIMHPNGGDLCLTGIQFRSSNDPPICVDVFLSKA